MGTAYSEQLTTKDARCRDALSCLAPQLDWLDPFASAESGFRNKAKLVVGGTATHPTLGILDGQGQGVDLADCGLYEPALRAAIPHFAGFAVDARLTPYDVPTRRGELKYLLATATPGGQLMLRIVLRSTSQLPQVRAALPRLQAALPQLRVVTVNLHPEHKAVLEGDSEIALTDQTELPLPLAGAELHLGPRSFFQTNTAVAAGLYRQAQAWIDAAQPATVLDLYCGVGGFTLHAAAAGRHVTGIEVAPDAIKAARRSASDLLAQRPDLGPVTFAVGDATAYAIAHPAPDLVVVNPPRRGLDEALTDWLEGSAVREVVYSSCNLTTLARDLARMPSLLPHQARLFDMFPQTDHHEVMVWLRRAPVAHA
jgi:23S rRNA (uracil747-C5)-methyltransferase